MNEKSDLAAKNAYCAHLLEEGYESADIKNSPVDIIAHRNGQDHLFEIKYTQAKKKNYFGAATLTEWQAALVHPDRFWFVVAFERNGQWIFHKYTPEEFRQMSYIPPFKIYFNVPVDGNKTVVKRKRSTAILLTYPRLRAMLDLYDKFRNRPIL